jgi:hypothetical protein
MTAMTTTLSKAVVGGGAVVGVLAGAGVVAGAGAGGESLRLALTCRTTVTTAATRDKLGLSVDMDEDGSVAFQRRCQSRGLPPYRARHPRPQEQRRGCPQCPCSGVLSREEFVYSSADRVADQTQAHMFPPEYLHTINPPGFAPHELRLKVGIPIILLRNVALLSASPMVLGW